MPDAVSPAKLRVDEVAERYGLTRPHVYQLANERKLPHYKVGKVLLFDPADVEAFFEAQKVDAV